MNGTVMLLFWVDDCIFYSKNKAVINIVIDNLKDECLLEREGDIAGFLGLQIDRDVDSGSVTLTQTDLIKRILVTMDMTEANHKFTLTDKNLLHKDLNGEPCCEE